MKRNTLFAIMFAAAAIFAVTTLTSTAFAGDCPHKKAKESSQSGEAKDCPMAKEGGCPCADKKDDASCAKDCPKAKKGGECPYAKKNKEEKKDAKDKAAGKAQTVCPVMGEPIDKQIYVDYNGYRVYFCCQGCVAKFNKEPEKFLKKMKDDGVEPEKSPEKK